MNTWRCSDMETEMYSFALLYCFLSGVGIWQHSLAIHGKLKRFWDRFDTSPRLFASLTRHATVQHNYGVINRLADLNLKVHTELLSPNRNYRRIIWTSKSGTAMLPGSTKKYQVFFLASNHQVQISTKGIVWMFIAAHRFRPAEVQHLAVLLAAFPRMRSWL